jgi:hypothetical protein
MKRGRVLKNDGGLAVRTPKKSQLPMDERMIAKPASALAPNSQDDKGWPDDLETRFGALADLELPIRPIDSKPIGF